MSGVRGWEDIAAVPLSWLIGESRDGIGLLGELFTTGTTEVMWGDGLVS